MIVPISPELGVSLLLVGACCMALVSYLESLDNPYEVEEEEDDDGGPPG